MSHYRIKGSSPRVRGKPGDGPTTGPGAGLIPARAGKTGAATPCGTSGRAHPRACGENPVDDGPVGRLPGSSPRVRGKRRRGRHLVGPGRLIPARAGKTCHVVSPIACSWAHPRACGENGDGLADGGPDLGSSPRVRGKPPLSRTWTCLAGLIPACAGKTPGRPCTTSAPPAHPRACGENRRVGAQLGRVRGSSPRVRGKLQPRLHRRVPAGLIPARAGKTQTATLIPVHTAAHPRACGENARFDLNTAPGSGSSPRVRGKHSLDRRIRRSRGLIPARAGKTWWWCAARAPRGAHPRACGENPRQHCARAARRGSSPRVRGKPRSA